MDNRVSTFSNISTASINRPHNGQTSTTTLLNALHNAYTSGEPYPLDASTSLVVNTWLSSEQNGRIPTIDRLMVGRAWEHARRRAEDGTIVLLSAHDSTPSCLTAMISELPITIPSSLYTVLNILRPLISHVTPLNASYSRCPGLAVKFDLSVGGEGSIIEAAVKLSSYGIDTRKGFLEVPQEQGYRAFDVFYYLLTTASTQSEREFLGLKEPTTYALLSRSGTYDPPSYLPAADDAAAGEDFRAGLREIGITGASHRNFLTILAGLLKLGDTLDLLIDGDELDDICEDVAGLFEVEPEVVAQKLSRNDRGFLVLGLYECLLDWILVKANAVIQADITTILNSSEDGRFTPESDNNESASLTIMEVSDSKIGRALAMNSIFDDTTGINSEMKEDGIEIEPASITVLKDTRTALNSMFPDHGHNMEAQTRQREYQLEQRTEVLDRIAMEADESSFLRYMVHSQRHDANFNGLQARIDIPVQLSTSRVWYHINLHPTDDLPSNIRDSSNAWSASAVSRQLRAWRLPEWSTRRNKTIDFTADFDVDEFSSRYARLGCQHGRDGVENWLLQKGWSNGEAAVGHERVWIHEDAWWEAEGMLDLKSEEPLQDPFANPESSYSYSAPGNGSGFFPHFPAENDALLGSQTFSEKPGARSTMAPTITKTLNTMPGDYGLGAKGDDRRDLDLDFDGMDPEMGHNVTSQKMTWKRRIWVTLVWTLTFWIPSPVLKFVGRMKRRDVRMAWREKLALVFFIALLNAVVVFWIISFGNLICPNTDKVWNPDEVAQHQGNNDFYVSFHGGVYDLSNFWEQDHSDIPGQVADKTYMEAFGGQNVDNMFTPPLNVLCPNFVKDQILQLSHNNTPVGSNFYHVSGTQAVSQSSALASIDWWNQKFLPKMKTFYKGNLVYSTDNVTTQGSDDGRNWVILNDKIYDLTDYFYTLKLQNNLPQYNWLPEEVSSLVKSNQGKDISSQWGKTLNFTDAKYCFDAVFAAGIPDFRLTARCQANNYILLAFTIIICAVILIKFVSALQFGSRRRPQQQDKFVIMQVPAYTEGEDALRKSLDSLTALQYDNKRKLICVVCDGMIVGGGNDRPTPKIVLDILGVDPRLDPPALPFKSVGQGNEQLNYGKVYSGLYEFEGNVVPFIVVVKVGKDSEQTKAKPGNRGKRDSQIMLMRFLNRVHHRSPMAPLELEMFAQIRNVIGVNPELYEYLLMVDADTSVREDSLNRLVSACANDSKIAGICGETSLENEEKSLWTMIQVYEYYISHHLAKAFESLFGSVTCLPGCFCMYRLRTADKGKPLIIHDKIIEEYSDGNVDTLHKKNLLSLGEDRYLTTLMTKYFPSMSYKFVPDAFAATAAPETWSVLLSQRRRWINSTIHNLAELVGLRELCGFCCFSMRFVVFLDLFGTLILPATCVYLGYLIYKVATHSGQFPLISIILIAAVYGLQAIIFILKRQWQHVGWMLIYLIAFPIYSFLLPIYSFWKQDDFSWGNTRIVIGEKGNKQIIAHQDEGFDPRSVPLQRYSEYALQHGLAPIDGPKAEKFYDEPYSDNNIEMEDMHSVFSGARPASTVLSGFGQRPPTYVRPEHSRQSTTLSQYKDAPQYENRGDSTRNGTPDPYRDSMAIHSGTSSPAMQSQENLLQIGYEQRESVLGTSRPVSSMDLYNYDNGIDEQTLVNTIRAIVAEGDWENLSKRQIKEMVEHELQTELNGQQVSFLDNQVDIEVGLMDA